jgi:hypothetical protein
VLGPYAKQKGLAPAPAFLEMESLLKIIKKQAKKDGYNPMQILDTLKGIDNVEISALVSEILNYNRVKTSFLGYARGFEPHYEVQRNVLA